MDVGEFNGRSLYTGLGLDYRLRLWAPTCASRAISAVAELLVLFSFKCIVLLLISPILSNEYMSE